MHRYMRPNAGGKTKPVAQKQPAALVAAAAAETKDSLLVVTDLLFIAHNTSQYPCQQYSTSANRVSKYDKRELLSGHRVPLDGADICVSSS